MVSLGVSEDKAQSLNGAFGLPCIKVCVEHHAMTVRTKDRGRLYQQYRYWPQLLCMKGDENQVENSTNELPRNLYSYIENVR